MEEEKESIAALLPPGLNKIFGHYNEEHYIDDKPTFWEMNGVYRNTKLGRERKKMHLKLIKENASNAFSVEMYYIGQKEENKE